MDLWQCSLILQISGVGEKWWVLIIATALSNPPSWMSSCWNLTITQKWETTSPSESCAFKILIHRSYLILNFRTSLTIFKNTGVSPWSLFRSDNAGFLLDFSFLFPKQISNTLQYELGYKEIFATTKSTPFFIREQCGPRLASIFRYTGACDQRDNSIFPTEGFYVRTTAELIGDCLSRYGSVKSDTHVEMNMPLFAGMSLQVCGRFGKIYEDKKIAKSTTIDGLFFLGGPQTLRGFDQAGATPCEENIARGTKVRNYFWGRFSFSHQVLSKNRIT